MIKPAVHNIDKGFVLFAGILALTAVFAVFKFTHQAPLYLIAIAVVPPVLFTIIRNPSLLYFGFFISSVLYFDSEDGITFFDAIYFALSLVMMAVSAIYILKSPDIAFQNSLDRTVFLFYLMLIYGAIVGLIWGTSPTKVIAGIAYYLPIFGYFFFRDLFREKEKAKIMGLIFLFMIFFVVIRNFLSYREILLQATMQWQAERARVPVNEVIVLTGAVFFITFASLYKKYKLALLSLLLFGVTFASLILTQSRGYWLAFLASCFGLLSLSDLASKKRLLTYATLLVLSGVVIATVFFSDQLELILIGLSKRFQSIGQAGVDISLKDRIVESGTVIKKISENPILGYGLGTTFTREVVSANVNHMKPMSFIHNGYLNVLFKFGIFGFILFLSLSFQILQRARLLYLKSTHQSEKLLYLALFSIFFGMLVVNNTSPQFQQFDSMLVITLMAAYLSSKSPDNTAEIKPLE